MISKTTTLHVQHTLFVHFFAVTTRQQSEIAQFHVRLVGTQIGQIFLSFQSFWTWMISGIELPEKSPIFGEVRELE